MFKGAQTKFSIWLPKELLHINVPNILNGGRMEKVDKMCRRAFAKKKYL